MSAPYMYSNDDILCCYAGIDWNRDFQDQLEQVIEAEHWYALVVCFPVLYDSLSAIDG